MTANLKDTAVRRAVVELIGLERILARTLGWPTGSAVDAEVGEALRRFGRTAAEHRAALEAYLASIGGDDAGPAGPVAGTAPAQAPPGEPSDSAVAALAEAYGALNDAAVRYGVLTTVAFRLYELPLRELAPKHLRDYAQAAQQINQLIAPAVAAELREEGLECQCVCPMCTLGACGCVAISTHFINAAWRETAPSADGPPGLLLQPPRPDSELARAGIRGGDCLLAVDDRPIQGQGINDLLAVQTALREHAPGEDVRVRVQRGSEEPKEVCVRPVADQPR